MKKRISHTQSTTNYCLISSTFQKSFKKKPFHCKFGKKNDTKNVLYLAQVKKEKNKKTTLLIEKRNKNLGKID
jgi:hypothetical protein